MCVYLSTDNPCSGKRCETYQKCIIDRLGQASCICPSPCQQLLNPVCSSDGVTYDNECELRRQACITHARIYVAHTGPCGTLIVKSFHYFNWCPTKIILINQTLYRLEKCLGQSFSFSLFSC